MIRMLLWAALGSGIGGSLRYFLTGLLENSPGQSFPRATFWINIAGSLVMGILWGFADRYKPLPAELSVFLITGICGGFTTFSAFSLDNMKLIQEGHYAMFALYAGGSVMAGLAALTSGVYFMKWIA